MKKLANLLIIVVCVFAFTNCIFASDIESIKFRDYEWLTPEKTIKQDLELNSSFSPSWYKPVDEGARIDSWYHQWQNMYSDNNITNGGTILNYTDVPVAGYTADLELSFIYPVINGNISYDTDGSLFYKAEYKITETEDIEGAYADLCNKLASLYGSGEPKSYYNSLDNKYSPTGTVWTAKDGSVVWLAMFYNSFSDKYDECWIVYAAPNIDTMLQGLISQMETETYANEAATRESNSENYEGL